jgi:hypothetical protein
VLQKLLSSYSSFPHAFFAHFATKSPLNITLPDHSNGLTDHTALPLTDQETLKSRNVREGKRERDKIGGKAKERKKIKKQTK